MTCSELEGQPRVAAWFTEGNERHMTHAEIKTQAVRATGAALNHEINNPLMSLMGNVELIMREARHLDDEVTAKLKKIQEAAEHIRTVTQKLIHITEARIVEYPGGTKMLDIESSSKGMVLSLRRKGGARAGSALYQSTE